MAAERKTVDVLPILERANTALEVTKDEETAQRRAIASLLESILFDANRYRGFRFTDGCDGNIDPTRRRYF